MRRRSRVLLRDAVLTAVAVLVLAGTSVGGWRLAALVEHHPASTTSTTSTTPTTAGGATRSATGTTSGSSRSPAVPALGVYAGPGAASSAEAFDTATGGKVSYTLDFLPAATWSQLSDPLWLEQVWAGTSFTTVIAVPMLPASGGTLAQGAAGDYDGAFTLLAQRLVSGGLSRAVLMIGWQPGSSQNPWQVTTSAQAAAYVAFWDRIHAVMAAVPGAHFRFEWDAGGPGAPVSPAETYPGNSAVDIIATDAFDVGLGYVPPDEQWSALDDKAYGPSWVASFAASHGKPLAVAMAGLAPTSSGGGGDNASFLTECLDWAKAAHASMVVVWDYGSWEVSGSSFPAAWAALSNAIHQGIVGSSSSVTP